MKFFYTAQVKELDAYTIEHEPIASIDLMERAARALTAAILERYAGCRFAVFSGPGNNGGDGLAVARMLAVTGCAVQVWLIDPKDRLSTDCAVNFLRLRESGVEVQLVQDTFSMPSFDKNVIIVDALFGSGLNKPVREGIFVSVINGINASGCRVVAVDMPSGLLGEDNHPLTGVVVSATDTLTLHFPKLSLLMPENARFVGDMEILDIALSQEGIADTPSHLFFTDEKEIKALLKPRGRHAHKGNFGRALLIAGSRGMAGASVLAARAALRSGVGLLTVHVPVCNNVIVQSSVPEATTSIDCNECCFSDDIDVSKYNAVAVGPGLGQGKESEAALLRLIGNCTAPMVVDADALNILSRNKEWLYRLPAGSVLTPHPGEFERLFGKATSRYKAIESVRAMARDYGIVIVLKGAYTTIIASDGNLYFNSTGNPGMATGGSGDVLTGILLSLLAQGYEGVDAARMAVYMHGLAGDLAVSELGETALVAGDIVNYLPKAWLSFEKGGKL
jgi:NAD(P)H-hydrate epimerase